MPDEILINVTPQETRVALVENGALQELKVERASRRGIVGNIYLGTVQRVLPGMGAAFIEVGLERTAFLHVSDILGHQDNGTDNGAPQGIDSILHPGQTVLAQVVKDPLGSKGARLTTRLSIPSRYLVFMPGCDTLGVSQRIEDEDERTRLRELLLQLRPSTTEQCNPCEGLASPQWFVGLEHGGYIVRTAAEGCSDDEYRRDIDYLDRIWASIRDNVNECPKPPCCVYEDLPLSLRILRDLPGMQIEKIRVDSNEYFSKLKGFAERFVPELEDRIEHYPGERPVLDLYSVEDEIQKALSRRVELKSGGHLVIDQTEAMTTIDINTGAFVGHRNLAETIFKTNLEAAQAIARQLRLRNLGGIIIIDFIDMEDPEHRRQVLRALERNLERDHTRTSISEVSSLGLVQLTRKRTRESLEHILCEPCPTCQGRGYIKSTETVCYEILREIMREARQFDAQKLLVFASQPVVEFMLDEESGSVAELEQFLGRPVRLQVEPSYNPEQYDVVFV